MARQKQKKWRVYFDLNAPREDRRRKRRPGRELPIHQTFLLGWDGMAHPGGLCLRAGAGGRLCAAGARREHSDLYRPVETAS